MRSLSRFLNYQTSSGFVRHIVQQFRANQGVLNAAALTYTTLFAVVPMMTVTYAMLASIPSFQGLGPQLESMIFDNFVPSTGAALKEYLSGFAGQARNLTGVGIGILVVTAYLMLKSIERAFNRIWQIGEPRKGLASFLLYWAVLSLGPMLLGLGLLLTSYITSLPLISDATVVLGGKERLLALLPLLFSAAAFTLLYAAVPNCQVPIRHAVVGGLIAALLFEAAKRGFALFVSLSPSYQLIYGAFAAVPLFLVWVYISWMIVLLGAELVRGLSSYDFHRRGVDAPPYYWGLRLLQQLWGEQQRGRGLSQAQLVQRLPGLSSLLLGRYLSELKRASLITINDRGQFLLCCDLHRLTVEQFTQKVSWPLPNQLVLAEAEAATHWTPLLAQQLQELQAFRSERLQSSLAQLFSEPLLAADEGANVDRINTEQPSKAGELKP